MLGFHCMWVKRGQEKRTRDAERQRALTMLIESGNLKMGLLRHQQMQAAIGVLPVGIRLWRKLRMGVRLGLHTQQFVTSINEQSEHRKAMDVAEKEAVQAADAAVRRCLCLVFPLLPCLRQCLSLDFQAVMEAERLEAEMTVEKAAIEVAEAKHAAEILAKEHNDVQEAMAKFKMATEECRVRIVAAGHANIIADKVCDIALLTRGPA